jgi:hypothetical protein
MIIHEAHPRRKHKRIMRTYANGGILKLPMERLVDSTLKKYNLPEWIKPYVYKYVRDNPVSAVKFAISLIDVKRKKGEVSKTRVKLPNGTEFSIESILNLLNLFFYGEENMARIEKAWAEQSPNHDAEYEKHFLEMAEIDSRRTRAIKNLAEGLGRSVGEQPQSLQGAFERIGKIESWHDRVVTTGIVLRYSYATTFGIVFYKVFYPVSPEFMRSFGKAFGDKNNPERWDTEEAEKLIRSGAIEKEHLLNLARELLSEILCSIESNMKLAKQLGLEKEVRLLGEISVAYPFQKLSELGIEINVDNEVRNVKKMASQSQ